LLQGSCRDFEYHCPAELFPRRGITGQPNLIQHFSGLVTAALALFLNLLSGTEKKGRWRRQSPQLKIIIQTEKDPGCENIADFIECRMNHTRFDIRRWRLPQQHAGKLAGTFPVEQQKNQAGHLAIDLQADADFGLTISG
jgi:hypothetical protein